MAVTQNLYTGDGATVLYPFTFPYLEASDIKTSVNGNPVTAFTLANATTVQFNVAPANGAAIRIYRTTDFDNPRSVFLPGSAIRANDLNEAFEQSLFVSQETQAIILDAILPVDSVETAMLQDGAVTSAKILDGTIVNADINASAAIVDTKLATIATGGKVSNSATTATNANTANAIVARDASGNFSAGTITAALTGNVTGNVTGNAGTVTTNANLTGDVTSVGNATTIAAGVIVNADINASAGIVDTKLATIATTGKVSNSATTATNANTASAIVARDASGNFSAGTITANLTGTASNVTTNANLTGDVTSVGNATTIAAGVIVNADVNASAAIAGTKISPNFGSQNTTTTGTSTAASFIPSSASVPTNGIYLPAANQVAIAANSTGRLFVDASGNVGVGAAPGSYKFDVQGGGQRIQNQGGTSFLEIGAGTTTDQTAYIDLTTDTTYTDHGLRLVRDSAGANGTSSLINRGTGLLRIVSQEAGSITFLTTNTERLRIDSAGNVGIGTTSPGYPLEVARDNGTIGLVPSATNGNTIRFGGVGGTANQLIFTGASDIERVRIDSSGRLLVGISTNYTVGDSSGWSVQVGNSVGISNLRTGNNSNPSYLVLAKTRATSAGSYTIVQNNDIVGVVDFAADDGVDYATPAARILAEVDGTPGANDMPGRLVFSTTADGASSPTERLRITQQGVVAYNQAAPAAVNTSATITAANLTTGIITTTSAAAVAMTLPTGTTLEAAFNGLYNNLTFEFSVINTGPNTLTVTTNTGWTLTGSMAVTTGTSGRFAARRTAANTWTMYRI